MTDTILDRRGVLVGAGATLIAAPALAQAPAGAPIATTRAGQVFGRRNGRINVFQGVRYGGTTAGRRFMPPLPPQPWTGFAPAIDFPAQAPQLGNGRPAIYSSWSNPRPESEDCLFLNVYTPGLRDGRRRPVMVWFHGGGYNDGGPNSKYMEGSRLAARGDVVVVTVCHRLNAYGFMYLGHLDPTLQDSGNSGSLDMALALRWVRDNIREFGGDPNTVMIFGQSGGGGKVSTLLAMPAAEGLMHRAVVQSGSGITSITTEAASASTNRVLAALRLPASAEGVARLRAMPERELTAALQDAGGSFGPVLDGRTLGRHPFQPDAPPISRNVPMLIGSCTDETASLQGGRDASMFSMTWDQAATRLGADGTRIISELRRVYPTMEPCEVYWRASSERQFRQRSILQAERKAAAGGAPAYMYLFAWNSPVEGGRYHACHSVEHPFVFDNVAVSESMIGQGAEQQRLADTVSSTWIRFARTGNPGWAPYTPQRRTTMVFDTVSRVVDDPLREQRLLLATNA